MLGAGIFDKTAWLNAQTGSTVYLDNYLIKASGTGDFTLEPGTLGIAGGNIGSFTTFDMTPAEGTLRFIGNRAFFCHTNIASIEIPESVTRIGCYTTYYGRSQAILRAYTPGNAVITISGKGMKTIHRSITVR